MLKTCDNLFGNVYNVFMDLKKQRLCDTVSGIGIVLNFLLAAAKIVFGAVFGLISVVADGVNNLSDCGSGVVAVVSFRISAKPADKEHPYGHQRAEYIASMLIGFFVLMIGVELFRESIEKIIAWTVGDISVWAFVLLGVSVFVKAGMFVLFRVTAKKADSDVIAAAAVDSLSDCIATFAVIAGMLVSRFAGIPFDGIAGLFVVIFILWEGIGIVKKASSRLLGQAPDPATVARVRALLLEGEGVLGIHDLKLFRFGPNKFFATAHVEMDSRVPPIQSHVQIDALERKVKEETGVELTAHYDPVDPMDTEAKELEARIRAAVEGMYDGMDLHDFRLIRAQTRKIVFEVGIPFDLKATDSEVEKSVVSAVKLLTDATPVVTVERE